MTTYKVIWQHTIHLDKEMDIFVNFDTPYYDKKKDDHENDNSDNEMLNFQAIFPEMNTNSLVK